MSANAAPITSAIVSQSTTYFEDGSYVITVITEDIAGNCFAVSSAASQTKTGSKQAHYYNASNVLQFSILVNGTFTYDGTNANAIKSQYGYRISASNWKFVSGKSSYAQATATATCTFKYINRYDKTLSTSLTCAPDGTLS